MKVATRLMLCVLTASLVGELRTNELRVGEPSKATQGHGILVDQPHSAANGHDIKVELPGNAENNEQDAQKLQPPEISLHLLSVVEKIHASLSAWEVRFGHLETKLSTVKDFLEDTMKESVSQVSSKVNDIESQLVALEQRLEGQLVATEQRVESQLVVKEKRLEGQLVLIEQRLGSLLNSAETRLENQMFAIEARLSSDEKDNILRTEEKLTQEIEHLKEIVKIKDDCHSGVGVGVTMLGITYELSQFGKTIIDGVSGSMDRLGKHFADEKEEFLKQFQNITSDLKDEIDTATDALALAGMSKSFSVGGVEYFDRFENLTSQLEQAVNIVVKSGCQMPKNISKDLHDIREVVGDRKVAITELKNTTKKLTQRMEEVTDSFVILKEEFVSSTERNEQFLNTFAGQLKKQFSDNSHQLFGQINSDVASLNTSIRTALEAQIIRFSSTNSTIEKLYKVASGDWNIANCKKGMAKFPAHHPFPYLFVASETGKSLLCDTATAGGGWLLIQRRSSALIDFYRPWSDYKGGFGTLSTDFWIGLDTIHRLTTSASYELRIELEYQDRSELAHYDSFVVGDEADGYRLSIGSYTGNGADGLEYHNGSKFSTKDKDNDGSRASCATTHLGGWWYKDCMDSNLNGKWGESGGKGPVWYRSGAPYQTEMKIRRKED